MSANGLILFTFLVVLAGIHGQTGKPGKTFVELFLDTEVNLTYVRTVMFPIV